MDELKPCPFCGKKDTLELTSCVELEECANFESCDVDPFVCVVCSSNKCGCGATGGYSDSEEGAIEKWNRRPAPENNPLTLDQLRQMDGEPVWCDWVGGWTLVYIDGVSELSFVYCDGSKSTLSELRRCNIELLAYARKPEQEEK